MKIAGPLYSCKALTRINLSNTLVEEIAAEVAANSELQELVLNDCYKLKTIDKALIGLNKLKELKLQNCSSLTSPSQVAVQNGLLAIYANLSGNNLENLQSSNCQIM